MEEEFIKGLLKQAYSTYFKVIGKFPEIKKYEIRLGYDPSVAYVRQTFYEDDESGAVVLWPLLVTGPDFFGLGEAEKEAIIAHELGHYIRGKRYGQKKLEKLSCLFEQLELYYKKDSEKAVVSISDKEKRKMERIQKCYNLHEVYADNEAIARGYGKQILSALGKITKEHYGRLTKACKEGVKARMQNLESRLGVEDGSG
ncbi:MAG: hypothetical protein Q8N77_03620 [Nanoarchaeota archaeon]|nr:hypothetical protein [Nanoarchaeota archaeon]